MRRYFLYATLSLLTCITSLAGNDFRKTIDLNGQWAFDQTENAFPPKRFTRTIPVPGIITLAEPKISQYEKFRKLTINGEKIPYCNFKERGYTPMYNWYSKKITIDSSYKDKKILLNIRKSMYTTTVYINGKFVKSAVECSTPIVCNITDYVKFGEENEILIMVGDRVWYPSEAAGGTDIEKFQYISGIWDDVYLVVTGNIIVDKALFLPSLQDKKVTVKTLVRNFNPSERIVLGAETSSHVKLKINIKEKKSGNIVATKQISGNCETDNQTIFVTELDIPQPHAWSPEDPFLYIGEIEVESGDKTTDSFADNFGIRDFKTQGTFFSLNGQKYFLRGTNITLHRFFEDAECSNLPWNREWVKKLIIDDPKAIDWNAMRVCVGLAPDFWYDLCDEYGIMIQNEWMYWQKHGWDEQIRKEYTDWVWSDGNHPSIVIWDCINENINNFIGYRLIPELKELDPTRLFDAGYMVDENSKDDIDEPHPYISVHNIDTFKSDEEVNQFFDRNPDYDLLGSLDHWCIFPHFVGLSVPMLVNEYSWSWLDREGNASDLSYWNYRYFLGENATAEQRRELQAYWIQTETEWLRAGRNVAGIFSFCSLTNNHGKTGDWYIGNISNLEPSPALKWFKHCFAPAAVFMDLVDGRYCKHKPAYKPGEDVPVNFVGVNDLSRGSIGKLAVNIYNSDGKVVFAINRDMAIRAYQRTDLVVNLKMPEIPGGYLITAEYTEDGSSKTYISRRYVKVGEATTYSYYEIQP